METVHDQMAWHEAQAAGWQRKAENQILVARRDGMLEQARLHREAAEAIREALEGAG